MRKSDPFSLLSPIYVKGPLSRSDLAEMMDIAPSHVGSLIRKALNSGYLDRRWGCVVEGERHRILLKASPDFADLIGVDIVRGHIRIVVTNFVGRILISRKVPTETFKGRVHVLELVHDELKSQLSSGHMVAAIGITHSGVIDPRAGKVLFWPMVEG